MKVDNKKLMDVLGFYANPLVSDLKKVKVPFNVFDCSEQTVRYYVKWCLKNDLLKKSHIQVNKRMILLEITLKGINVLKLIKDLNKLVGF
ncbi:MAG: hypothetical protein ACQESN_08775 [Thermotogota bacterium]